MRNKIFMLIITVLITITGCSAPQYNQVELYQEGWQSTVIPQESCVKIDIVTLENKYKDVKLTEEDQSYYDEIITFVNSYNNMIDLKDDDTMREHYYVKAFESLSKIKTIYNQKMEEL